MQIVINGEKKEIDKEITLQELITDLDIETHVMAAAVNMNIVKKEAWKSHILNEDDKVELLDFVGGG